MSAARAKTCQKHVEGPVNCAAGPDVRGITLGDAGRTAGNSKTGMRIRIDAVRTSAILHAGFPQSAEELFNVEGQALSLNGADPFHRNRCHGSEDCI